MVTGIKHTSRYSKQEIEDVLEESRKVLENAKANPTVITENDEMNFVLSVLTGYTITSTIFSIVDYGRNLWNSKNVTPIIPKDAALLTPEPSKVSIEAQEIAQAVDPILKTPNNSYLKPPENISSTAAVGAVTPVVVEAVKTLPSFDTMKTGIKEAWIAARKTARLDGSHKSLDKVPLDGIVNVAKEIILDPKKAMKDHGSTMNYAANEVIKNLKALFGRIDPNLDANTATIATLLETGGHSNSHECLEHATQTALKNIKKQNAGFQTVFSKGSISYVPSGSIMLKQNQGKPSGSNAHKNWAMAAAHVQNVSPTDEYPSDIYIGGVEIFAGALLAIPGFLPGLQWFWGISIWLLGDGVNRTLSGVGQISDNRTSPPNFPTR